VEKSHSLVIRKSKHVVGHSFLELEFIEGKGMVVVHDFELSLESNNSSSTSGSELVLEFLDKGLWATA
jgi:hypothetical protein